MRCITPYILCLNTQLLRDLNEINYDIKAKQLHVNSCAQRPSDTYIKEIARESISIILKTICI